MMTKKTSVAFKRANKARAGTSKRTPWFKINAADTNM
jgi:hypothetical protein